MLLFQLLIPTISVKNLKSSAFRAESLTFKYEKHFSLFCTVIDLEKGLILQYKYMLSAICTVMPVARHQAPDPAEKPLLLFHDRACAVLDNVADFIK